MWGLIPAWCLLCWLAPGSLFLLPVVNLVCASLRHQGSKNQHCDAQNGIVECNDWFQRHGHSQIILLDVAFGHGWSSRWTWRSNWLIFFCQGIMQQKQRQQNNSQTCSARHQAVCAASKQRRVCVSGGGWQELELGRIYFKLYSPSPVWPWAS